MTTRLKSYNPRESELRAAWHVIDADGKILGRLATEVAVRLMGKDRPGYVAHLLSGDFVIVTNASKVRVTGKKADQKVYVRHNQYPGHRLEVSYSKEFANHPDRVIRHAVKGMLPKNKLGAQMLTRLKIYPGAEHPHSAQVNGFPPQREAQPATGGA